MHMCTTYLSSGNVDGSYDIGRVSVESTNTAGNGTTHHVLLNIEVH